MNRSQWTALGAIAGVMIGWSSTTKPQSEVPPATTPEVASPALQRTERPEKPLESGLASVEECRVAIAEAAIEGRMPPLERDSIRDLAMRRWIELGPDDAMKEILANPAGETAKNLLLSWVQMNPAGAMEALRQAGPAALRKAGLDMFASLLARNPAMGIAELKSERWNDGGVKLIDDRFKAEVYQRWMMADPQTATQELRQMFQKGDGWAADLGVTRALFSGWAEVDFQAAWDFMGTSMTPQWMAESDARQTFGVSLQISVLKQGLIDGEKGAQTEFIRYWDERKNGSFQRRDPIASIMFQVADKDPLRVLEFAENIDLQHEYLKAELYRYVIDEISHSDPFRALELFRQIPPASDDYRKNDLREIFAALEITDSARARTEMATLPREFQVPAIGGWLTSAFVSDPEEAIRQCAAWADDPALAGALGMGWAMAFSWGHGAGIRDPQPSLEAMPALNDAVDCDVLSTWVKGNPREAATWISNRLADGHQVDFGKEGILGDLSNSEPQWMSEWVIGVKDPGVREKAVRTLAKNWMAFDPQGAREWLGSLEPGDVKNWADAALADFDD